MLEVRWMSFRNRKCICSVKSTPGGSGSMKTAIWARKSIIREFHFLPVILTENMYLYSHSSEEVRLTMKWKQKTVILSTSGKNKIFQEHERIVEISPMPKVTIPLDRSELKKTLTDNTRGVTWRGLETEGTIISCPIFCDGKLIYSKDLGINVNSAYIHQRLHRDF